jgi:DNA-binding PadR family transcriptional regulator
LTVELKVNKPPRKVYQYNKANTEELKEKLRNIDIEKQLKEQDLNVDQLWNNFKKKDLYAFLLSFCSLRLVSPY